MECVRGARVTTTIPNPIVVVAFKFFVRCTYELRAHSPSRQIRQVEHVLSALFGWLAGNISMCAHVPSFGRISHSSTPKNTYTQSGIDKRQKIDSDGVKCYLHVQNDRAIFIDWRDCGVVCGKATRASVCLARADDHRFYRAARSKTYMLNENVFVNARAILRAL